MFLRYLYIFHRIIASTLLTSISIHMLLIFCCKLILIEGAIMQLARNQALKKFLGIYKNDPGKTLNSRGEGARTGLVP